MASTPSSSSRPSLFSYLVAEQHASGFGSATPVQAVVKRYGATNQVILITGASGTVGQALCAELCRAGATVLMGWQRDEQAAAQAAERLTKEGTPVGGRAISVRCDLSSLAGAQLCSKEVQALGLRLDVLVHCASTSASAFELTDDQVEVHFAVNYLGPLLLTLLLLPAMARAPAAAGQGQAAQHGGDGAAPALPVSRSAAATTGEGGGGAVGRVPRVVWCSCSAHHVTYTPLRSSSGCLLAWRVQGKDAELAFMPAQAFGQSKLACIMVARQLALRAAAAGMRLAVFAVHPGVTQCGLNSYAGYKEGTVLHGLKSLVASALQGAGCLKSPAQAAATVAYAALAPELLQDGLDAEDVWAGRVWGAGGAWGAWAYLEDCCLSQPSQQARSTLDQDMLWELSEALLLAALGDAHTCPLLPKPAAKLASQSTTEQQQQPPPQQQRADGNGNQEGQQPQTHPQP